MSEVVKAVLFGNAAGLLVPTTDVDSPGVGVDPLSQAWAQQHGQDNQHSPQQQASGLEIHQGAWVTGEGMGGMVVLVVVVASALAADATRPKSQSTDTFVVDSVLARQGVKGWIEGISEISTATGSPGDRGKDRISNEAQG